MPRVERDFARQAACDYGIAGCNTRIQLFLGHKQLRTGTDQRYPEKCLKNSYFPAILV
jgi:hypothetical protein